MCGIVGIWNLNGRSVSPRMLDLFTDTLAHRGPDGRGVYIDKQVALGLGHRRLAIIDTSEGGRQPMSYLDGRYWITYNGEIYNFIELKTELESHGYTFRSSSDTEVILAAYDCWGESCQLKFNGMWAFAVWDTRERKLFLSRDRFGVKPLHYFFDGSTFAFASEMKAFLSLDGFSLDFDPEMVAAALTDIEEIEGTENCIVKGIKRLLGGHCLTLQDSGEVIIRRWWITLDHLTSNHLSYESQIEAFRELFLDACRIRMRSDVPIGTALSGGLDSSSIVCAMHAIGKNDHTRDRLARDWQSAFIATYPGNIIDEKKYSDEVIKKTGVRPIYCEVNSDMYLKYFNRILYQFEEISDIYLGPWLVHKTQRESGIVVTIDGHGGDEILGGYPWHITAGIKDSIIKGHPRRTIELIDTLKKLKLFPDEYFYSRSLQSLISKWREQILGNNRSGWLRCHPAKYYSPAFEEDRSRLSEHDSLFNRLYVDFHFKQLPMNLRDFDRLSMAHGVEVRSPFMDWRLVCFAFSLPSESKIHGGYTKRILRDALKDLLPESIRLRTRKLGFPNMMESWSSPKAVEFIRDSVADSDFLASSIWDGRRIQKDLEAARSNGKNEQIYAGWIYVQAMKLMHMFRDKWRSYR